MEEHRQMARVVCLSAKACLTATDGAIDMPCMRPGSACKVSVSQRVLVLFQRLTVETSRRPVILRTVACDPAVRDCRMCRVGTGTSGCLQRLQGELLLKAYLPFGWWCFGWWFFVLVLFPSITAQSLCMARILERYERYSYAERELVLSGPESEGSWCLEYGKLKAKVEALQRNLRHFTGEDLDTLSIKELQQLENQLDYALKHIRSRKNQIISDSIAELQRKERSLREQNQMLEKKLQEKEKAMAPQAQWEQQNRTQSPPTFLLGSPLPTLNIGTYHQANGVGVEEEGARPPARTSSLMPAWLLRHVN